VSTSLAAAARASATDWRITLAAGALAEAASGQLVSPATPTATCGTGLAANNVTVAWTAAAHATGYTIYQSSTASTGPYTAVARAVPGTSWTSGALGVGSYWFQVATEDNAWISSNSAATAGHTIGLLGCS
jgi:hypothetical protein